MIIGSNNGCGFYGAETLSEQILDYYWFEFQNKFYLSFDWNSHNFVQETAIECVVFKTVAILSRFQCVHRENSIGLSQRSILECVQHTLWITAKMLGAVSSWGRIITNDLSLQ